ncbi:hypothetical protein CANCADRAFT_21957 [Tortispora caseinolytica NRRL Y-17796]|uniref:Protein farnesyltransferase/geranylgeranyltransferase type-1 subunit alpha n=1 Tax=Tortispora caseinolytica NRRL Y-17796 TaxID=767744 RepID=A0A1E4TME0_9ASCO|nr:hypothetical protein CANCADRAFT_21957 [Tortispora caseinolytica NRRL Y-17796]
MSYYWKDYDYTDVVPVPQDDGPDPLCAIIYNDDYKETSGLLRALMKSGEASDRALAITSAVIALNPAHYTVWAYRIDILPKTSQTVEGELAWLESVAEAHPKNYQILQYRSNLLTRMVEGTPNINAECIFVERMLLADSKNYHVWSYRQWLVQQYGLQAPPAIDVELAFVHRMLEDDIRNNSAWNHRFFVLFGIPADPATDEMIARAESEITYAKAAIDLAPDNASPWNYLSAVLKKTNTSLDVVEDFCLKFANIFDTEDTTVEPLIMSRHALALLGDLYAKKQSSKGKTAYQALANKYDPIRANYWSYMAESS